MSDVEPLPRRRQWLVIGGVFAAVFALIAAGYYLFLTGGYTVLADNVRPGEAAAIVAELDKRGTAYRLRDGGTTVLVPDGEADTTRLALVRSDAAEAGQIGFELFNKSDMGLTNFAQKINYQRALQGELVRTITAMDGVDTARVHLALPERSLFRDDRTEPSAAVTVAMRAGLTVEPSRVAGIQQLVAAAVPDLPVGRVVVLDADGRVISPAAAATILDAGADGPADLQARAAAEQYYRARARAAVEGARPGLRYQLSVVAVPRNGAVDASAGASRDFRLQVALATADPLDGDAQAVLRAAIGTAVGLDDAQGDALTFETRGMAVASGSPPARFPPPAAMRYHDPTAAVADPTAGLAEWAWGVLAGAAALMGLAWWRRSRRPALLTQQEHEAFAQQLRRQLALTDGSGHAAR